MSKSTKSKLTLLLAVVAGASIFGLAMAIRENFEDLWVRAAVAGGGASLGSVVGLMIIRFRKPPEA